MGHGKLKKFAENETFSCLLQPSSAEILSGGFFNLADHPVNGNWRKMMFGESSGPVIVELGCGRGEYTLALARRNPSANYVGVDIKGARLWSGARAATLEGLHNAAFLRTRVEFLTAFFAPGEVSEIWLTFSDPQLKSENSRLSSPSFLERYRSILSESGIVHLKTDSRFLHEYTKAVIDANALKVVACTSDLYGEECLSADGSSGVIPSEAYEVHTYYENMFAAQGYKITYLSFVIDHEGPYVHPADFDSDYWRSVEGPRHFVQL